MASITSGSARQELIFLSCEKSTRRLKPGWRLSSRSGVASNRCRYDTAVPETISGLDMGSSHSSARTMAQPRKRWSRLHWNESIGSTIDGF